MSAPSRRFATGQRCPLCQGAETQLFHAAPARDYLRCVRCLLVFVPPAFHLDPVAEKAHYDTHDNRPDDPGYRRFLARLADPLADRLAPGSSGLDFGCGPGPCLALMLEEQGHRVALHDAYYHPAPEVFAARHDFITATEVIEHLSRPGAVLDQLWSCLKSGGWLALMTSRLTADTDFARWYYKNDPTHIAFFAAETFHWLAARWGAEPIFVDPAVVLLQKS